MSESKKKFEQEAKAFFADKKNDNVNTLYVTSDGNLFRAQHYADNWKASNPKLEIEVYHRNRPVDAVFDLLKATLFNEDGSRKKVAATDSQDSESDIREALVKEYIELFDKKPNWNLSADNIKKAIEAKKAELAKTKDTNESQDGEKKIVTEEDLQNNPELVEQGVKVGDEVTLPNQRN